MDSVMKPSVPCVRFAVPYNFTVNKGSYDTRMNIIRNKRGLARVDTEADMSGSEFKLPESIPGISVSETESQKTEIEPLMRAENLILNVERFSKISSELTSVLTHLSQEIRAGVEQLDDIRIAVEEKRKELKTLHGIEATAVTLERMALEYQRRKESLEREIADGRALWEEEKVKRAQEEKEYQETVRVRREKEEEAFRQHWANERHLAQRTLDEDLKLMQEENLERQRALERSFLERELKLKEKELEWMRLVQELEQFLSRLTRRMQHQSSTIAEFPQMPSSPQQAEPMDSSESDVSSLREILIKKSGIRNRD